MAENERPSFELQWPELAERVEASLGRRGVPPWLRDDIVQETGLRLFRMWEDVDPDRSPYGLALTISNNLLWDSVQRNRRREVLGDVPDTPGIHDVERSSIARLELARVGRSMQDLSAAHRTVLLAEVDEAVPRPAASPAAVKMLRMRARRKLNALLEQASAFGAFAGWELRKRAIRFRSFLERNHLATDGAAAALTSLVATVTIITGVSVVAHANSAPQAFDPGGANVRASAGAAQRTVAEFVAPALRRGATRSATTSGAGTDDPADKGYEVVVGEGGPVEGGASVSVTEKENEEPITPPDCRVSQPSENEVTVSCKGSVGSTEIDATATVKVRP